MGCLHWKNSHYPVTVLTPFPTRRPVLRPLSPSGWVLPEVYPVWSPAKFFCSGSLWLIRQGIQVTHICKSHPCFPWESTAYKYLVFVHIFHLLALTGNSRAKQCVSLQVVLQLLQVFLIYWKLWTPFSVEKKIQERLILRMEKLYLDLSNCMQKSLVPACWWSRMLHSPRSLDNPKHKWSLVGKRGGTNPCLFHLRGVHSLLFMDRRVDRMLLASGVFHTVILPSAASIVYSTLEAQTTEAASAWFSDWQIRSPKSLCWAEKSVNSQASAISRWHDMSWRKLITKQMQTVYQGNDFHQLSKQQFAMRFHKLTGEK